MSDTDLDERTDALDEEAEEASLGRRLWAELVGTLVFVAIGTGAATALAIGPLLRFGALPEGLQQDPAQAALFGGLLGTGAPTISELLPVALAFATGLAVMVYAFGGTSGAHFNPAVTFSLAVSRRFRWKDVVPYWIFQCLGAIIGTVLIAGIYRTTGASILGNDIMFGATTVAEECREILGVCFFASGILAEAFITFILVTAIMAVAVDPRAPKGWSGLIIGLALGAGILVTGAASGGSANFARSLGPFVVSSFFDDVSSVPWNQLYVYAVGPLIGGAAAALVYETTTGLEKISPTLPPAPMEPPGSAPEDEEPLVADQPVGPGETDAPPTDRP